MIRTLKTRAWSWAVLCGIGWAGVAPGQTMKAAPRPAAGPETVPSLVGVAPPGATLGKTTEWAVTGRNLGKVESWLVSGGGVEVVDAAVVGENSARVRVKVAASAEPGFREVRAVGPMGISNLFVVRVDALEQVAEVEPNDLPAQANALAVGSAAWGVLKAQDVDFYRIEGKAGARVTLDLEAQRLGSPITPVVSVTTAAGVALGQARETRGTDHDARLPLVLPADGVYLIQVRDSLYTGGDTAHYRLRVKDEPFATGLSPLGGPAAATIMVTASGGNLEAPRTKAVTLPKVAGTLFDPGPFDGPGGPILAPMRLMVGEGKDVAEAPPDAQGRSTTALELGASADGRIDRPGEVDRYLVKVKKGEVLNARIRASDMGSWLDSVLTVRDASGAVLVENDDPGDAAPQRSPFVVNQSQAPPDSRVAYEARADGEVTIEVADRYNEGGAAYGYRLEVGASKPDFAISLLLGDPNAGRRNNGVMVVQNGRVPRPTGVGVTGALNLRPGASVPINFLVTSEGRTGPIEVTAELLPPGITANPQTIRTAAVGGRNGVANRAAPPSGGALILKVDSNAEPQVGELRIVATAKPDNGPPIVRVASAAIAIDTPLAGNIPSRPVMRTLANFPIRILGDARTVAGAAPKVAAPAEAVAVSLKSITVPGVLLQGGRLDLILNLDPPTILSRGATLTSTISGASLSAQVVATDISPATTTEPAVPPAVLRVVAAVDAAPGVRTVTVKIMPPGGAAPIVETASVIVRPPIVVRPIDTRIEISPEAPSMLRVAITREPGFAGAVELKLDLPDGVKAVGRTVIAAGATSAEVVLKATQALEEDAEVGITGIARMPRGPVRAESAIRPMLVSPSAEKKP